MKTLVGVLVFASLAGAQIGAGLQAPAFEVAVIKANVSGGGVTGGCHGVDSKFTANDPRNNVPLGRCVITAGRLSHLMGIAYDMSLQRISGFPDWDGPSRFDIEAKVEDPSSASEQQLLSMLQAFLADRFKLKLHRETKEVPGFALVAAKGGSKLQASQEGIRSPFPETNGTSLILKGYSLPDLAEFLSNLPAVGRPVRDMTGLKGRFDIRLNVLESRPESIGDLKVGLANWQSIFADLQAQLGLRLENRQAEIETLVIDSAEKPLLNN